MKKKTLMFVCTLVCLVFIVSCYAKNADKSENIPEGILGLSKEQWKEKLTPLEYKVLWEEGTERPFTGDLLYNKETGVYVTAGCKQPVFRSDHKYDSKTGWPSFWQPISEDAIELRSDYKLGVRRTEVLGSKCKEHLGHVFEDGPEPTGLRYCINSAALDFISDEEMKENIKTK